MTSKEALEMIVVDLVPKAKENNKEEIKQIEKDLEVLEILKKCNFDIDYEDGHNDKFILGTRHYVGITQEEVDKIKEWLENEKKNSCRFN